MVAETVGGETVRAWIWQPEHEVSWVAERGAGTWRDGVRVHTAPVPDEREPQGVTSMWSMRDHASVTCPRCACRGCAAASTTPGSSRATDYIVYSRSNPWDHAPGTLLVTEAGGTVGHPDGTPYGPRSLRPGLVVGVDPATLERAREACRRPLAALSRPSSADQNGTTQVPSGSTCARVTCSGDGGRPTGAGASVVMGGGGSGASRAAAHSRGRCVTLTSSTPDASVWPDQPHKRSGLGRRSFVGYVMAGTTLVAAADFALGSPPARRRRRRRRRSPELYDLNDFADRRCRPTAT